MKTDGEKYVKKPKDTFCTFLSRTPANSHTVTVYCRWLVVQRDKVTVILSVLLYSILSVQIVYSVQLNCTGSN